MHKRGLSTAALLLLIIGMGWAVWRVDGATDPTRVNPITLPEHIELRNGDIIIAGGVSLQSRLVRSLTKDNTYSHVGIIRQTPRGLCVIHAAPQGDGDGGLGDRVAEIPLSLFLAKRGYVAIKVMRLAGETSAAQQIAEDACQRAMHYAQQAIPFDKSFDLDEQEEIYCSELVYLAYQDAGHNWPDTLIAEVSTLAIDGPVILPGNFAKCPGFETIWQHN